jgi:lipooligosaccharide transport system ATP-binding protein
VQVFGEDVSRHPRRVRSRRGVTLQENALIESLSAVENLRIFGRYHLLDEARITGRIEELLDFLELRSHAALPVKALSGGFQRRLSIALSLMNEPELLILDEPTTGLDPAVRIALWTRVRALREAGATVLLTTHYMDEAERLCDELAIMAEGRVAARGAPAELIRQAVAPEAVELALAPARQQRLLGQLNDVRYLEMGPHLLLYASDGAALLDSVRRAEPEARLVAMRASNLEDVFLALTGTQLEAGA